MTTDQIVSISELKKSPSKYIKKARQTQRPQIIFSHNKPQAMLIDMSNAHEGMGIYDKNGLEYVMPYPDEIEALNEYEKQKKDGTLETIELTEEYMNKYV